MPGGPGHVLAAVDRDVAALVVAGAHPPDRVEPDAGQRPHRREILAQRLGGRPAVAAAGGVDSGAALGQAAVELGHRAERGNRDEQVAAQEAHGVLDRALLVAGVGVAVAALEAVVASELGERARLGHLPADHPAVLGRVVERRHARGAAPAAEDLGEPGAQALGPLRPQRHALPVVGVRQRADEQLQVELLPRDGGAEVAEVDLAGAGRPLQLQVALAPSGRAGQPPVPRKPADRRVGPLIAALGDEPVAEAPGGVPLLARGGQVGLQRGGQPRFVALQGPAGARRATCPPCRRTSRRCCDSPRASSRSRPSGRRRRPSTVYHSLCPGARPS